MIKQPIEIKTADNDELNFYDENRQIRNENLDCEMKF
jgi:hypothetical protein